MYKNVPLSTRHLGQAKISKIQMELRKRALEMLNHVNSYPFIYSIIFTLMSIMLLFFIFSL